MFPVQRGRCISFFSEEELVSSSLSAPTPFDSSTALIWLFGALGSTYCLDQVIHARSSALLFRLFTKSMTNDGSSSDVRS